MALDDRINMVPDGLLEMCDEANDVVLMSIQGLEDP